MPTEPMSWTGDPDSLLETAVYPVMNEILTAFVDLWSRETSAQLLEDFMAGRAKFLVDLSGVNVLLPKNDEDRENHP